MYVYKCSRRAARLAMLTSSYVGAYAFPGLCSGELGVCNMYIIYLKQVGTGMYIVRHAVLGFSVNGY